ncbi:MAG: 23S rRNA (adenine(2503)-C(2))-methyltransferase RlmN [Deltaproteobacteria bacterium]|nr:23S rRNA (adenine(2503)-C(2))-methyltransferase RlmN [Deltaproteobacteria bacterium]
MDLRSLSIAELRERVARAGEPPFRAEQLFRWLHGPGAGGMGSVRIPLAPSTVPRALRDAFLAEAPLVPLVPDGSVASVDGTRKFRFRTHDDRVVESVLIPDDKQERSKLTLCISCQVGCAWGCTFCATATMGFGRNLTAGEMVEQLYWAMESVGQKPTNVVFMGMGEPLHNFDQVTRALSIIEHPWGAGLSPRRLTVSTAGVVSGMDMLGRVRPLPNLAISLNATTDEVRDQIMPINRRWRIASLLAAARRFPLGHHRRITFEYVLFAGVNDSDVDAARLPRLLSGIPSKVNLIPWNPVPGLPFSRPSEARVLAFQNRVRRPDLPVYVRTPRGDDSAAACGQLAARIDEAGPERVAFGLVGHLS